MLDLGEARELGPMIAGGRSLYRTGLREPSVPTSWLSSDTSYPITKPDVEPPENRWKTAVEPPENRRKTAVEPPENRWRTAEKLAGNRWKNCRKTGVEPLENRWRNRWKTGVEPLESRWKAAGRPLAKLPENRPETAGKSPVFGSLLPVSIRDWNGREGPLRRHFSAPGGGCHKETTFQAQLMYFSIRWGWRNGDLRVFRRDEGSSRSDDGFCGISR